MTKLMQYLGSIALLLSLYWVDNIMPFKLGNSAYADVLAPMAPPELSDTLTDFRTKQQLSENVYIEGRADPQNSLDIPTVPGDLESKVMRLSAMYQAHYEIAVPKNGISILRIYDLNGYPMEIVSTRVENQGFLAEITAAPSEIMIRQLYGASSALLNVRLKGIAKNFLFVLKPLVLINQQSSVRTLITSMTVNYYVDGTNYIPPSLYKFEKPNPMAKILDFAKVDHNKLENDLLEATSLVMPLSKIEKEKSDQELDKILSQEQAKKSKQVSTSEKIEEEKSNNVKGKTRIYNLEQQ